MPAGRVVKWEWFFSNVLTTGRLDDFSLKLCHTTRTALTSTYADNYAGASPVQVFYRARVDVTPRSNEWFGFDFDSSFPYDGARNLIVELRWKTGTETRAYTHSTVRRERRAQARLPERRPRPRRAALHAPHGDGRGGLADLPRPRQGVV